MDVSRHGASIGSRVLPNSKRAQSMAGGGVSGDVSYTSRSANTSIFYSHIGAAHFLPSFFNQWPGPEINADKFGAHLAFRIARVFSIFLTSSWRRLCVKHEMYLTNCRVKLSRLQMRTSSATSIQDNAMVSSNPGILTCCCIIAEGPPVDADSLVHTLLYS